VSILAEIEPMNSKQKITIWIGTIIAVGMGLYPPWTQSWSTPTSSAAFKGTIGNGAGAYSWIWEPPGTPALVYQRFRDPEDPDDDMDDTLRGFLRQMRNVGLWRSHIDTSRLLVQWVTLGILVAALVLTLADRESTTQAEQDGTGSSLLS
jgi:hypothetical protein